MKYFYSFRTDDKLRIQSWGDEISGLTGRRASAVLGKKYYDVLPRIIHEEKDALTTVVKKQRDLTLNKYNLPCFQGLIQADFTIAPLPSENGAPGGVEVTIQPLSVCPVAQRLHNSQRLIDIGKMASTLAHGVRNPLNAIKGAVIYLREKYASEATLIEFTRIIEEEISRLDTFISRFLSTSISESEFSLTDVNELLRKVEITTSLQAQAYHIELSYNYGDIPPVMINGFQLEQAVLNVVNNAIEAMPTGGKLLVKTKRKTLTGADFAIVEISDTGPGISRARLEEMFVPMEKKGRGFGLFLTREILQSYGGRLEIKSGQGAGTTVRLYLPVKGKKGHDER